MPSQTTLNSSQATSPLPTSVQNTLYSALLSTHSITTIQATLVHELQASGWTTNLRAYIQQLLRSGECSTYNEVMERVIAETKGGVKKEANGVNGVNGYANGNGNGVAESKTGGEGSRSVEDGGIQVPERAVREGVRVVRRELEKVLEVAVDGGAS